MTDIGIFATAPKGLLPESLKYARACLAQGKSYQTTASICGVNELDLREMLPGYGGRQSTPVPEVPPFVRLSRILPTLSKADLARAVALGAKLLDERSGRDAVKQTMRNALPGIVWEPLRFVRSEADSEARSGVTGKAVAQWVAERYGLTLAHFRSEIRSRDVARPRQVAMYLMREFCPHLSFPAIGRVLGGRDHTTVLHGIAKVKELRETDPDFRKSLDAICQEAADRFSVGDDD